MIEQRWCERLKKFEREGVSSVREKEERYSENLTDREKERVREEGRFEEYQ